MVENEKRVSEELSETRRRPSALGARTGTGACLYGIVVSFIIP